MSTFNLCVQKMQEHYILKQKDEDLEKVVIHPKGDKLISLHFSLVRSLLECYWATIIYLVSLLKSEDGVI